MSEIIKFTTEQMPQIKFVGLCYDESEKTNGTFSEKWEYWFQNEMFSPLMPQAKENTQLKESGAYCGLCRIKENEAFRYWIGMFLPIDAAVPEGYESIVIEAGEIAVCWVYGKEPDIYTHCCLSRLKEENYEWTADSNGAMWCFERYAEGRFTVPDEKGNVILDMCFYIKPTEK